MRCFLCGGKLQNPGAVGAPAGTLARYQLINALSYISSEFHGTIGGLFYPASEEIHNYIREKLSKKLAYVESTLIGKKNFVVGDSFTVADAYLYIVLTWTGYLKVDLAPYPNIQAYSERIANLEPVKAALARISENPSTTI